MTVLGNLDTALDFNLLALGVFQQNYGGFFSAILAPTLDDAGFIEGQLNGGDAQAIAMQVYLEGAAGSRFPIGSGKRVTDALEALNEMLGKVAQADRLDWLRDVQLSYESLQKARQKYGDTFLSQAGQAGELHPVD